MVALLAAHMRQLLTRHALGAGAPVVAGAVVVVGSSVGSRESGVILGTHLLDRVDGEPQLA